MFQKHHIKEIPSAQMFQWKQMTVQEVELPSNSFEECFKDFLLNHVP